MAQNAAEKSLAKLDDPSAWDLSAEDVPIFVAHDCYKRPTADGKSVEYAVVGPGESPKGDGWELYYEVGDGDLKDVADEISRLWNDDHTPLKLFAGHSKPPTVPQSEQPPLVGYGAGGAYVGKFGGKGKKAVFLKRQLISKGYGQLAAELPERSPEFKPDSKKIKALALIKTNPRLDLGMTLYQRPDGVVCYAMGVGDMDPTAMPPGKAQADGDPPASAPDDPALTGELSEARKAEFMRYMEACYPSLHAMAATPAAATPPAPAVPPAPPVPNALAAPSGSNGALPGAAPPAGAPPVPVKPPDKDLMHMTDTNAPTPDPAVTPAADDIEAKIQTNQREVYAKRLKEMDDDKAGRECDQILYALSQAGVWFEPGEVPKEKARLLKLDAAGRKERHDEILARWVKDPARGELIDTGGDAGALAYEAEETPQETQAIVRYCEQNDLDVESDGDWRKAKIAVAQERRRQVRAGARR